jgi:putative membrane protein
VTDAVPDATVPDTASEAASEADGWHRLSPLSPLIQAGRLVAGLFVLLAAALAPGGHGGYRAHLPDLLVVVVLAAAALVRWLVTRWRLEGSTLRIETGLFRRDSQQLPVARIQAVDVVRPFLARVFGLAELRIRLAGSSTKADGRLAYLTDQQAATVRAMLLGQGGQGGQVGRGGQGGQMTRPGAADLQELPERPVSRVPPGRLIAAAAITAVIQFAALGIVVAIVVHVAPRAVAGLLGTLGLYALGLGTAAWRRVSQNFGFTVALAPDGLRIRRGLLGTVAETVPVHRVQAVRMVQPVLWRPFGWCKLQVSVAGSASKDEGSRGTRKEVLPVGPVAEAEYLAQLVLRHQAPPTSAPPRRARRKAPFSYHFLAAGHDDVMAVTSTGRLTKETVWLRLEKLQSIRFVQGPVQRRLGLATVHADAAGRRVQAAFRDRPEGEARELLDELAVLSRAARQTRSMNAGTFPDSSSTGE